MDGATGVDKRQRMMDRFNRDEKVFSFILSTFCFVSFFVEKHILFFLAFIM